MLNEEDKTRIHLEEAYRNEVRKSLEDKNHNSIWEKLWLFLNSSFGLWLFSAILVGGFVDHLKKEDARREEEQKIRERVERLNSEIEFRISQTIQSLYAISDHQHPEVLAEGHREEETMEAARTLLRPATNTSDMKNYQLRAFYPEYSGFSVLALIAELRSYTKDPSQLKQLNQVIQDMSGLDVLLEVEKADLKNPQSVAGVLLDKFVLDRWKDSNFYFLDCGQSKPFC